MTNRPNDSGVIIGFVGEGVLYMIICLASIANKHFCDAGNKKPTLNEGMFPRLI